MRTSIPAGTFLCSVTPAPPEEWVPGLVPTRAARWNAEGKPAKYFADSTALCLAELVGTSDGEIGGCTYECWQATAPFTALDVFSFPPDIVHELYADGGTPAEKWRKCHLLLALLGLNRASSTPWAIKGPSPYGEALGIPGYTLAADPALIPLKLVRAHPLACR